MIIDNKGGFSFAELETFLGLLNDKIRIFTILEKIGKSICILNGRTKGDFVEKIT